MSRGRRVIDECFDDGVAGEGNLAERNGYPKITEMLLDTQPEGFPLAIPARTPKLPQSGRTIAQQVSKSLREPRITQIRKNGDVGPQVGRVGPNLGPTLGQSLAQMGII